MKPDQLNEWFAKVHHILETTYLSHQEPWKQSGMSGPEERWISLRKPVADCIDRAGSFLDVGCANGYLLECCIKWIAERGIAIEPYGVDVSSKLVELAKQRLPQYANNFFIANAFRWIPPFKFDFVRTNLEYVPAEYEKDYLEHLLNHYVKTDGNLLVANYLEDHPDADKLLFSECHPTRNLLQRLAELGFETTSYKDGYDLERNRKVRIAILRIK